MESKPYTPTSPRIADLADDDKPREKAMRLGVRKLTITELIAIALGSGIPGKSVIDLSREILRDCQNRPEELSKLTIKEMCRKYKGVGPARAVQLAAAIELGRRCATDKPKDKVQITDSQSVYEHIKSSLEGLDHEEFMIVCLDRANNVKNCETISTGGTAATVVDIKILLKRAIDSLADAIILAHNHPSGNVRPSLEDDTLTSRIKGAAKSVDIRVLDHIIVGTSGYYSYSDQGRL